MADFSMQIEGADALVASFNVARRDRNKVLRVAMRDAAKACAKAMRPGIPARWRGIIRSKAKIDPDGTVSAAFGLSISTKNAKGHQPATGTIKDWYKAYWLNYGTLEGRDPSHHFSTPVKHSTTTAARNRRGQSGIPAQRFFDEAISGYEQRFVSELEKAVEKNVDKMFGK